MNTQQVVTQRGDALIIVDVQNDFLPGGSLAVPDGDAVIPVLNSYIDIFTTSKLPVFATRDWHPPDHVSFVAQGGIWPPHCIRETEGAAFGPDLNLPENVTIISKAINADEEAYSGFSNSSLNKQLRDDAIKRLFIGGLATDYCVLNTVDDAIQNGYQVFLLQDAIRAVNVKPEDGQMAIDKMMSLGAQPITLAQVR